VSGSFRIAAPPGGVIVVVSALGYVTTNLTATVSSGGTTNLAAIELVPLPTESSFRVSGVTMLAGGGGGVLAGVAVSLTVGSTIAGSAISSATGAFELVVPTGQYVLRATLPGYSAIAQNLSVEEPISGVQVALSVFGWAVTGTVTDGLTTHGVSGVAIWSSTGVANVTDSAGRFAFTLPNGTYTLQAVPGTESAGIYATIGFQIVVAAAPVTRSLTLLPSAAPVSGSVTSAADGSAIVGASVTVAGIALDGAPVTLTTTTDPTGHFALSVYLGNYTVTANQAGFSSASTNISVGVTAFGVSLALVPLAVSSGGTAGPSALMIAVGGVVIVVAAVAAVLIWGRRRGGAP
jgi:hypothetical protein